MTDEMFLVTGGTGMTGSRVTSRLRAQGLPVATAARRGERYLDWADPRTWDPALTGASAVYLCFAPDLAVPRAAATVAAFTERAAAAGVRRVVLLSGRGEQGARAAERAVGTMADRHGLTWTVLRCSWFVQDFDEGPLTEAVGTGELALPVDGVVEPFIDADDVAAVAELVLTGPAHHGRVHELTGPRAVTFADVTELISRATGRQVRFRSVPVAEYVAELAAAGLPAELVELFAHLFTEVLDGRNSRPSDGVRQALGRPATDVAEVVARAAAAGHWR
jgi:uncharacterized protein YbjT (DUF2867 family)